jgi:predicted protein tyrosine phosphatase
MPNQVKFCSRTAAEGHTPAARWAVISINEPDAYDGMAKIAEGWHSVLRVSFHDVTMKSHGLDALIRHCSVDDARQIVEFVRRAAPEVEGFLVHCRAGVSRSAAVAKWISGEFRIPFDRRYDKYNDDVYRLLIAAGKAK